MGAITKVPKTESSKRVIGISDNLVSVLREYKEWYDNYREALGDRWVNSNRVFIKENGEGLYPSTVESWVHKICKAAGLPNRTVHSLRHTNITMLIGQSPCLQQANTYMNRAVGFFLQKNGIPVIPNIRWSDESSFEYCFLGVPKGSIVSVSTHGCLKSSEQKQMFKTGMVAMLEEIRPQAVLVHGFMPDSVFGDFKDIVPLYRYASEFERTHIKEGA